MSIDQQVIPGRFAFGRMPQNDEELWWFVRAVWGITIPRTSVCPGHVSPFQAFADAYFARHPVMIWKASRGLGGKSWLLATLANTMAVGLNAQSTILGGSSAQSLNVHMASQQMWAHDTAPKNLLDGDPTKMNTHLHNGAWLRCLMASQAGVRGPHPQRLLLDEIDEMELDILEAAQGQPMRGRHGLQKDVETCTVMSSTHQYPDGTMTKMLDRAEQAGWPVYHWCYRESSNPTDGWLTMDEVQRKRSEIPKRMWETEYELQEPSFEGRAIDNTAIEASFDPAIADVGGADEWQHPDHPAKGNYYVTGVDWAKEKDLTVISTFHVKEHDIWECVAVKVINRSPWPYMVHLAEERLRLFPPAFAHDATGLGNVIKDYFDPTLVRRYRHTFSDVIMGSGRARHDLFSEYISALEGGHIRYPRMDRIYREHKYVTLDDLFGRGHPPDSVVAGAIAWSMRTRNRGVNVKPLSIGSRPVSPWTV